MPLKSRTGQLPPPNYYAAIFAYLLKAYPRADLTKSALADLKPAWDHMWQSGRPAEVAAKSTCSCDGKTITLSPAFPAAVVKGAYRAPQGAPRGALFDVDEMRESAPVERARSAQNRAAGQAARLQSQTERLAARLQGASAPERQTALQQRIREQQDILRQKREEAETIGRDLAKLQEQFQTRSLRKDGPGPVTTRSAKKQSKAAAAPPAPTAPPPAAVKKPAARQAAPKSSAAKPPPPATPGEPRPARTPKASGAEPGEPRPARTPKASGAEPVAAADQALLTAIQGMLPAVAKSLAAKLQSHG